MKRRLVKVMALLAMAGTLTFGSAMGVMATTEGETSPTTEASETTKEIEDQGDSVTFKKYLVMKNNAKVPNVSFNFSIAPVESVDAPILKGLEGAVIKLNESDDAGSTEKAISFTQENTTKPETDAAEETVSFVTTNTDDEKFAEKSMLLDFSKVEFSEPGTYRYQLTEEVENKKAGTGIVYDGSSYEDDTVKGSGTRFVDVHVFWKDANDHTKGLIKNYTIYKENETDKVKGITNTYDTYDLTISKKIAGTKASPSTYFKFTVNINNDDVRKGGSLDVDLSHATTGAITYNGGTVTNPNTIVFTNNSASVDFYLKGNESITIKGITWYTSYKVSEDKTALDKMDYKASAVITGDDKNNGQPITMDENYGVNDSKFADDTTIAYTNTSDGVIPTGVMMSVLPGAIVLLLGAAGITLIVSKKRREDY